VAPKKVTPGRTRPGGSGDHGLSGRAEGDAGDDAIEDAAGGGTDLDASATYDLSTALAAVVPHPQQGIHLRLTVHAAGSQGADTKFKEFWVQGCGTETPPTTPTSSTSVPEGSTTTSVPIGTSGGLVSAGTGSALAARRRAARR
jgi:hypothetical protein